MPVLLLICVLALSYHLLLLLLSPIIIPMLTILIITMIVMVITMIIIEGACHVGVMGVAVRRGTHCPCSWPAPPYCCSVTSYSIIPYSSIL